MEANLIDFVRHLSVSVRYESMPARLRGFFESSTRTIVVNSNDRPERQLFTVAHELGELHANPGLSHYHKEKFANEFASNLLLPEGRFRTSGDHSDWDLASLKSFFPHVSWEVIARRVLRFHSCAITILDDGKIYFRKANGMRIPRELLEEEKEASASPPAEVVTNRCRTRSWPVVEDVERVILLTEEVI